MRDDVLSWLPNAIAAVAFLGAVAVYLRGSRDKGTIESLERSITALEAEREIQARKIRELQIEVTRLDQANRVLENVANSGEVIAAFQTQALELMGALTEALNDHHSQAMGNLDLIHGDLTGLKAAIEARSGGDDRT